MQSLACGYGLGGVDAQKRERFTVYQVGFDVIKTIVAHIGLHIDEAVVGLAPRTGFGQGHFQPRESQVRLRIRPPSTRMATPVMKLDSSQARNRARLATSQPVPWRLRGTLALRSAMTSSRGLLNLR